MPHAVPGSIIFLLVSCLSPAIAQEEVVTVEENTGGEVPLEAGESIAEQELTEQLPESELRELQANENPEAVEAEKRKAQRQETVQPTPPLRELEVYGSARIRLRTQSERSEWQDGGSRAGAKLNWEVSDKSFVFGRAEVGFNLLDGFAELTNPGEVSEDFEDSIFERLLFLGFDAPIGQGLFGKNWSPYYSVAEYTDRFVDAGGSASGAFNADTDGGPTGTGRADKALQTDFDIDFLPVGIFKPFKLNVQVQNKNEIPFGNGLRYGVALGSSAEITTRKDFKFGFAYNRASIGGDDLQELNSIGLTGDAEAVLLGTRAFGDRWYAGLTLSRLKNHMTTDEGNYFDALGAEFYSQYQVRDRLWLIGGFNGLRPDSNEPLAGDYRVLYGVFGVRLTFDGFQRMIYANYKLDDSRNADGTRGANVLTLGIRWKFRQQWSQRALDPAQ